VDVLLEKGLLPEFVIRAGIRRLLKQRLKEECIRYHSAEKFIEQMKTSPIALQTRSPNEQHYELPTPFFQLVLGKHLKYSSGYWNHAHSSLDQAEVDMLKLTCDRAGLSDGQQILELGCGWGSLSLWMAEKFPKSRITSISNSCTQKAFIDSEIVRRGLKNLQIITADMNMFDIHLTFDRVVSVEMFEHMRNYERLLEKISRFLNSDGRLFVHIFTHHKFTYPFEVRDESD